MVRELKTGLLLILAWVTGSLAIKVWPQVNLAELALLDRIGWVFFFFIHSIISPRSYCSFFLFSWPWFCGAEWYMNGNWLSSLARDPLR